MKKYRSLILIITVILVMTFGTLAPASALGYYQSYKGTFYYNKTYEDVFLRYFTAKETEGTLYKYKLEDFLIDPNSFENNTTLCNNYPLLNKIIEENQEINVKVYVTDFGEDRDESYLIKELTNTKLERTKVGWLDSLKIINNADFNSITLNSDMAELQQIRNYHSTFSSYIYKFSRENVPYFESLAKNIIGKPIFKYNRTYGEFKYIIRSQYNEPLILTNNILFFWVHNVIRAEEGLKVIDNSNEFKPIPTVTPPEPDFSKDEIYFSDDSKLNLFDKFEAMTSIQKVFYIFSIFVLIGFVFLIISVISVIVKFIKLPGKFVEKIATYKKNKKQKKEQKK